MGNTDKCRNVERSRTVFDPVIAGMIQELVQQQQQQQNTNFQTILAPLSSPY